MVDGNLTELREALESGALTSEALVRECLERISDPAGEGARAFLDVRRVRALEDATYWDQRRQYGELPSPFAGIPISVKDLFDLEGEVTRAGSVVLADAAPAACTAPAIGRLQAAGFVVIGRTNMTEFAYSGVGINPHYGTPLNPWDRLTGRIPGGSSSGAAVSVTDGMAAAGIGTDTGGSCRIPAALTGLVGFKPTAASVPLEGVYPLAPSLDSVGSLAHSVACCALLHRIMSGQRLARLESRPVRSITLGVLDHYVTEDMDAAVAAAWESALKALTAAGVRLQSLRLPGIEQIPELNAGGGIAAAEAFAHHRSLLERAGDAYDPRVADRIRAGARISPEELARILAARRRLIAGFGAAMTGLDALVTPTVPLVAPALSAFEADEDYVRLNLLLLRNPSLVNFLDGCAVSVPMQPPGAAPVGLMLAAPCGSDGNLLAVAGAIEGLIRSVDNAVERP